MHSTRLQSKVIPFVFCLQGRALMLKSLSFGTSPIHFARTLPWLEHRFGFEIKYHIEEEGIKHDGMSQHPLHIDTQPVPTGV